MSLEREYQNKLDGYSRINEVDQWFQCRNCQEALPIEDICDHDGINHTMFFNCCRDFYDPYHESIKEDLD